MKARTIVQGGNVHKRNQQSNAEVPNRYNESSQHQGKTIVGELITSSTSQKHNLKLGDNIEHGKIW